ncbi:IS30 family transposase [Thiospirochaeta perfilievii]|uniref:IS30 family transposase n=1 Tax=Thiospirochaeta perfilievii TaxID=252967 RepID=A0A5C1Q7W9_9SPIO|nr:helix-turn-helix domain-containing protein [Thiospirochaeta perfilievii]QEN04135.1 IS30 family transposase [Thiospirochaeta perfilievii]
MSYKHLDYAERYYIYTALKEQTSIADIAKSINRHPSTLHREINRNNGNRGYRYKQADNKAKSRHEDKPKAIKITDEVKSYIHSKLKLQWSPEQIAGRIKDDKNISIHHETIYKYVLVEKQNGGILYKQLRYQKNLQKEIRYYYWFYKRDSK